MKWIKRYLVGSDLMHGLIDGKLVDGHLAILILQLLDLVVRRLENLLKQNIFVNIFPRKELWNIFKQNIMIKYKRTDL